MLEKTKCAHPKASTGNPGPHEHPGQLLEVEGGHQVQQRKTEEDILFINSEPTACPITTNSLIMRIHTKHFITLTIPLHTPWAGMTAPSLQSCGFCQ